MFFGCLLSFVLFIYSYNYNQVEGLSTNEILRNISNEERYQHYLYFSRSERIQYREKAREMFQFAYDNYMKYAFPQDELDPIHCRGRGPDSERPYVLLSSFNEFFVFFLSMILEKIIILMMFSVNFL